MVDERNPELGALVERYWWQKTKNGKKNPRPLTLCSKQILTGGYPDRTLSSRNVRPEINYWINGTALTKIQMSKK